MILQALKGYYDRLAADPESGIAPYGYSEEKISFALVLNRDGTIAGDPVDLRHFDQKKLRPALKLVPRPRRKSSDLTSNFLWDKASFALGLAPGQGEKKRAASVEHAEFIRFHREVLATETDDNLRTFVQFLAWWQPSYGHELGCIEELREANIVFRLTGENLFLHERPNAQSLWAQLLSEASADPVDCLITGELGPLAVTHPPIKGVRGAQTRGAAIVSFNDDAYCSYGKEQGANAPVSEAAAAAYTTGLNHLLRQGSPNRVQLADASTVFWAEAAAKEEEALMALFLNPPEDEEEPAAADGPATARLRSVLAQMARGVALRDADPGLREGTRFHVLGSAPNAARIALRFYVTADFGTLAARYQQHWQDLTLEPLPWRTVPSIRSLLREIAIRRDVETIPAGLAGETLRAILTGQRYPRSLFAAVIMRLRAERQVTGLRAAILKACLTRDARISGKEAFVADDDREVAAGKLGRLFAILENLQRLALGGNVNATIRDRYFAAASAMPAAVFPMLVRNATHHVGNLRKDGKGGLAYRLEERMAELLEAVGTEFPRSLVMEDQGRFAIGYYRERYAKRAGTSASEPVTDTSSTEEG